MIAGVMVLVFLITETWATLTVIGAGYILSIPFAVRKALQMKREEEAKNNRGS